MCLTCRASGTARGSCGSEPQRGAFRADIGYGAERVAIELDGATYHGDRTQRERDMRRDAAFASIDWVTLRFSHDRLHGDVEGCRRDSLATLAARRRRFGAALA
jgi:very-short-patch-repair endonuclease